MDMTGNIRKPIVKELEWFEEMFAGSMLSNNPLLSGVNEYVRQGNGKQLRPMLVLLCAKLCGKVNRATIQSAVAVELLHTASLIHDDIVDDTSERRGRKSVKAQWNNKIAVLSGDYMLSNALHHATMTKNVKILESISNIGMQLSDGELLQLMNNKRTVGTEESYFNVIRKKTALLFSACTEIGAVSVGAPEDTTMRLRNFGEHLGICFQLKDDIFDYYENTRIGKPTGNDIRDGKVTLPLIYALRISAEKEKARILDMINRNDFSPENVHDIMCFAREKGGIDYAEKQMQTYKDQSLNELSAFDDSELKEALRLTAEFVVAREK